MAKIGKKWIHRGVILSVLLSCAGLYLVRIKKRPLTAEEPPVFQPNSENLAENRANDVGYQPLSSVIDQTSLFMSVKDKETFLNEVALVFASAPNSLDREDLHRKISRLNERGDAATAAVVEFLQKSPSSDNDIEPRLAMIDYLVYRAKFDMKAKHHLIDLASTPIPEGIPERYLASSLADRAEMTGGLAGLDWQAASNIIRATQDSLLKQLMTSESYYNLLAHGAGRDYALSLVQEVSPYFTPRQ